MIEPYKMVVVNLIFSLLLLCGVFIYYFIYPKKKVNLLLLLLLVSFLPVISIFRIGAYESGDFNLHIYRTISFYQNLMEGNIVPSWAGELNHLYGYPLFVFINPLPYYLISFFHFIGFSFIMSMKLFLATCYIFSGLTMYIWILSVTKKQLAAFTAAICYLFFPYHLVDQHFRTDIGEILSFTLLPLFFYFLYKTAVEKKFGAVLLGGMTWGLLIIAHQATALFSFFIIIPYVFYLIAVNKKRFQVFCLLLLIGIIGLALTSFSWLSYLTLSPYTLLHLFPKNVETVPVLNLVMAPWRMGLLFQGPMGQLSYLIGYTQLTAVIVAVVLLLRKKIVTNQKTHLIFWLCLSLICMFLASSFSEIIWRTFPVMHIAGLSSRLLLQLSISLSMVVGLLAIYFEKKRVVIFLFIIISIGYTILNWGNRGVIQISDQDLINNLPNASIEGEGLALIGDPKWINPKQLWAPDKPTQRLEVLSGNGKIQILKHTNTNHVYRIQAETDLIIKENTWYFPGWSSTLNSQNHPIMYTNKTYPGVMLLSLPKGNHELHITYEDPFVRRYAIHISILLWIVTASTSLFLYRSTFFPNKRS